MYGGDWLQTKAPLGFGLLGISSSVHCVSSKMNTGTVVRDRWTCQVRDTLCSGSDVSSSGHKERHEENHSTRGDTRPEHSLSLSRNRASPLSNQLPLVAALVLFATNTVCACDSDLLLLAPDWLIERKIFRIPQPWFSLLWP